VRIERFSPEAHYGIISEWWEAHKWPVIPLPALPQIGMVVIHDKPVCAGWLYKTDSTIGWMEWLISDRRAEKSVRGEAIDLLIDSLLERAKQEGMGIVFTSIRVPKLIKRLEHHGFSISDANMTNMTRTIWL